MGVLKQRELKGDGCSVTGLLTASAAVKASAGDLLGVTVEMTDDGGDGVVEVWDSPDSTLTDDDCLARVTVTTTTSGAMASWALPHPRGVHAGNGLYMKVIAGDVNVIVYYN